MALPEVCAQSLELRMELDSLDPQAKMRTVGRETWEPRKRATLTKWKVGHSFAQKILYFSVTVFLGTELGVPLRSEAKLKAPETATAALDHHPECQISR